MQELATAVQLAAPVGAGRAVPDVDRDLDDAETLAAEVDTQRGLDPEPTRQRQRGLERDPGQAALTGQRLLRRPAGRLLDSRARASRTTNP